MNACRSCNNVESHCTAFPIGDVSSARTTGRLAAQELGDHCT
jgi:hypothetical protein